MFVATGTSPILLVPSTSVSVQSLTESCHPEGNTSDCIRPDTPESLDESGLQSDTFTVTANVTVPQHINTCDPWAVTVQGGTPPYTFTLLATHMDIVTNVSTVEHEHDTMIWVNRARPGQQLTVAASDS